MRKMTFIAGIFLSLFSILTIDANAQTMNFHDFKVQTIEGEEFNLSLLKGKKVLVVNTASECGFTGQYEDLQKLYEQYGGEGFEIVGFPANNFGGQEPGSNAQIAQFCKANYGVTFPMMAKISVKGSDAHPLYQWLSEKEKNGVSNAAPKWNFHKYLIDSEGNWVVSYPSTVKPMDSKITDWIKE